MKKLAIITLLAFFLVACKPMSFNRSERIDRRKIYVYAFKATYFRKMLLAGFRNSNEINTILREDHSVYSEPVLSIRDYKFLDSLVAEDTKRLIADSAISITRAEGAQGKRVFDFALDRYQSKWFKRIAIQRSHSFTDVTIVPGNSSKN